MLSEMMAKKGANNPKTKQNHDKTFQILLFLYVRITLKALVLIITEHVCILGTV